MRGRTEPPKTSVVVIVSSNPETLDGLQSYLNAAGVIARCTSEIDGCASDAPEATVAVVLFPDDFDQERVIAFVGELANRRSNALPILVTAHPKRFEARVSEKVLVMPRPIWGWTILDAVRAHLSKFQVIATGVGAPRERR